MAGILFAFVTACGLALVLTPACGALAARWGVLDRPAPRKVHLRPTPLLGGVAVYAAFAAATVVFLRPVVPAQMVLLLAGAAAFGAIGLFDDLRDAGAWKLAVEAAIVTVIVWAGRFQVNLPWPGAGTVLAILWILGVANALNCLDCTDGVAPGVAGIGAVALAVLALAVHREGVAITAAAAAGAAFAFLRYNFPPARIFLGDAGSLMLGFVLAGLGAALTAPNVSPEWLAPLLILSVPVFDFLFVHLRRCRTGVREPLRIVTSTGKDHLPHRLLAAGLSPRQAAMRVYRLSALLGASALALVLWGPLAAAVPALPLLAGGPAVRARKKTIAPTIQGAPPLPRTRASREGAGTVERRR